MPMLDINTLRMDLDRVSGGVWFCFDSYLAGRGIVPLAEPSADGASMRIAQYDCEEMEAERRRLYEPFLPLITKGLMDPEQDRKLANEVLAVLVKEWRGLTEAGKSLECTRESVLRLLVSKDLPQVRNFVWSASRHETAYRKQVDGALLGN